MTELFGIPMSTIVLVLAAMLVVSLLSVAWVFLRRRVIFNLGARNIPRRKAQTALIVFGLMLSTLIVTAALGTGDAVDSSMTAEVYGQLGEIDQFVTDISEREIQGNSIASTYPEASWHELQETIVRNASVDGASPFLEQRISARALESGTGVPELVAMGLDPLTVDSLGELRDTRGAVVAISSLPADSVLMSESAAEELQAGAGDTIELYSGDTSKRFTVAAVVENTYLAGVRRDGESEKEIAGMAMALPVLQQLSGLDGQISAIALSNHGGVHDGVEQDAIVQQALTPAAAANQLAIVPLKQQWLDDASFMASIFTGLFLVVGLFSIAAGILLILLIFTMLAAERRSEMGMARAVGAQRSSLVQQFMSEGAIYALIAGLVGSALGVGVAYAIARGFASVFGDFAHIQPSISPGSVIAGYCLGVVITFIAVVVSSWRVSRLNIVAAVRDLPDLTHRGRSWRALFWQALMVAGGVLLTMQGVSSGSAFPFMTGVSLLVLSIALILRQLGLSSRLVFTVAGVLLLVFWLLPSDLFARIFGEYSGNFEMFFVSGIFLVISATLVIMQNDRMLLGLVSRAGSVFRSRGAALKLGVAYPGAARSRTGMTIAMFSLIVFSLVMLATINLNFQRAFLGETANAGWNIEAAPVNGVPIDDLAGKLADGGLDPAATTAIGTLSTATHGAAAFPGGTTWYGVDLSGMDAAVIDETSWSFSGRAAGYASDAAILEALRSEPDVAVVDSFTVGGDEDPELAMLFDSIEPNDTAFTPLELRIRNGDGDPRTVRIIGVIDPTRSDFNGIYGSNATMAPVLGSELSASYLIKVPDASQAGETARNIQSIMLPYGVKATSLADQLREDQEQNQGFFNILQAFMGLGLIVGIAAIGVISFRNVIERRQQIGMLRAIGFQPGMVSWSFLIEAAFIVGMGVLSGTVLGLALARNLLTGAEIANAGDIDFVAPWETIGIVLALAVVAALITTWLPARQASRIVPAEALRYE